MNELQIFNNPEFGKVRTLVIDGEPWFVGKDIARALGYGEGKSLANAVAKHVDDEDKGVTELVTPGGKQQMTIINESGVYSLIFSSKLPKAKEFKRWVTSEVLPAIRKQGGYLTPAAEERLLGEFQKLAGRVDAIERRFGRRKVVAQESEGNFLTKSDDPFAFRTEVVKPPVNKERRRWMRTASTKLDMLSDKFGLPSSTALYHIYQEMEDEQGVDLSEVRLKALEEHQLTDCSILAAIFYDKALRGWFQNRVDHYLAPETQIW